MTKVPERKRILAVALIYVTAIVIAILSFAMLPISASAPRAHWPAVAGTDVGSFTKMPAMANLTPAIRLEQGWSIRKVSLSLRVEVKWFEQSKNGECIECEKPDRAHFSISTSDPTILTPTGRENEWKPLKTGSAWLYSVMWIDSEKGLFWTEARRVVVTN